MNAVADITEEEVASLTQSILVRYGLDFTCYEPKSLRRRIVRLLTLYDFQSIHDLWMRMLGDRAFIFSFMNEVSVGMTSMFRDPIFWKHLKRLVLKKFADRPQLSVWHAGCSTGEEVYSLAILLTECDLISKTTAHATDINQEALRLAALGEYHKLRMIENERDFKEYNPFVDFGRYYTPVDGKVVRMNENLSQHVKYRYHNLITDPVVEKYDLILCRNVMIYFDNDAKRALLQKFYDCLNPGGYFVIGFFDTMLSMIDEKLFKLVDADAKIFQKVSRTIL